MFGVLWRCVGVCGYGVYGVCGCGVEELGVRVYGVCMR